MLKLKKCTTTDPKAQELSVPICSPQNKKNEKGFGVLFREAINQNWKKIE